MALNFSKKKDEKSKTVKAKVSSSKKDCSDSAFFAKKVEEAKRTLEQFGLPKELNAPK
ncbi:hypothetical protein [Chitinophaga pinensis]|uniref:hypothetical protein n=1 Tax=Chitinophaga pinensis TaxID=79329 RepID=UPI0016471D97|nr:hypothetical protein [Chitinophaga pinensis]